LLDQGEQHWPVGIIDRAGLKRVTSLSELVPRRDHGYARPCAYLEGADALRGGKSDMARIETLTHLKQDLKRLNVLSLDPDIISRPDRATQDDGITIAVDMLLHDHGVGPLGNRSSGEQPGCLAWSDLAPATARGNTADYLKADSDREPVPRNHGIAVHCGLAEGRRRDQRDYGFGKRATVPLRHWDDVGPDQRRGVG
jgi:hypothetical protein